MPKGRSGIITEEFKGKENTAYHDVEKLFKIYRSVNWKMQIKINQVKRHFQLEYGTDVDKFLDSLYQAGMDVDTDLASEKENRLKTAITMQSEKYENRWEITLDDFVGVLCRARMSEREAIQLIVEMYRPLMLKYANLNTGFDDDLYQEFVCCVISCIFKFPFEKWNAENDLD